MDRPPHLLLIQPRSAESRPPLALAQGSLAEIVQPDALAESRTLERLPLFDAVVLDARGDATPEAAQPVASAVGRVLGQDPRARVVVVAADGADSVAAAAAAAGAWLVCFASEAAIELPRQIAEAARMRHMLREQVPQEPAGAPRSPQAAPGEEAGSASAEAGEEELQMVGTSEAIRRVFRLIRQVAPSEVPVLITGESGTGKELAALAIHERSGRAESPFVAINCAAIPEHLLESELFGYEKGAFTGATQSRKGRFEAANGGTIFLDEVGDLAPLLQVKLLRFLQDHVVERLGSRSAVPLDVRVLAATNRDITAMVQGGEFREDLYFRLAVFTIHMPPLRERGEDVVLMARHFLQRYGKEVPQPPRGYTPEAVEALLEHDWPGNVRELINRVRRAIVVCEAASIPAADLGLDHRANAPLVTLREARNEAEARALRAALRRTSWNKVEAAQLLNISRAQLYELIAKHKIPPHDWG